MSPYAPATSRPITLSPSQEAQVYGLVAVAMALTVVGVFAGMTFALPLLTSGFAFLLLIVEIALIFTAPLWMRVSPLNYLLFGLFPLLSGLTFTPYVLSILAGYANGAAILLNAAVSTAALAGAAAVFARTTNRDLSGLQGALVMSVIGLLVLGLLQLFFPSFRTQAVELLISGAGVVVFAVFVAFDVQRTEKLARMGANPFMLALSLYLSIFNLFVYILRFMVAFSGRRD